MRERRGESKARLADLDKFYIWKLRQWSLAGGKCCSQLLSCFGCQQRRTTVIRTQAHNIRTTVIMLEIFSDLRSLLHYSHVSIDSWVFRLHYRSAYTVREHRESGSQHSERTQGVRLSTL